MSVPTGLLRLARDEGGFSLIEMLTVLAILLTVVGTLTVLMVSATKSEVDLTERVRAQQQARLALEMMRRDVHCATDTSLGPDAAAGAVTLTLPIGCPSAAGLPPTAVGSQVANVTWCTDGSGSRWALLRVAGAACTTTGARRQADYLTLQNVFTLRSGQNRLDKLCTVFPVDLDPTDTRRAYRLKDALVLRNSPRGTSGVQAAC